MEIIYSSRHVTGMTSLSDLEEYDSSLFSYVSRIDFDSGDLGVRLEKKIEKIKEENLQKISDADTVEAEVENLNQQVDTENEDNRLSPKLEQMKIDTPKGNGPEVQSVPSVTAAVHPEVDEQATKPVAKKPEIICKSKKSKKRITVTTLY